MTHIFNKKTIYIKIQFGKQILYRNYEKTSETLVENLLFQNNCTYVQKCFCNFIGKFKIYNIMYMLTFACI